MNAKEQRTADRIILLQKEERRARKKLLDALSKIGTASQLAADINASAAELNNPPVEDVIPRVVDVIFQAAKDHNAPKSKLVRLANGDYSLHLETDLRIPAVSRENLTTKYTAISTRPEYPNGRNVGKIDSRNATTVELAIKRVHLRANGQP